MFGFRRDTEQNSRDSFSYLFSQNSSRGPSADRKIGKVKSNEHLLSPNNESVLSISKISVTSNSKFERYLRKENEELERESQELRSVVRRQERRER